MKFAVVNLGCKVNRVEADTIAAELESHGHRLDECDPGLVVVNTCTVTGEAEKKARKAVRHALSAYPGATVAVCGCAAAINPGEFQAMGPRVKISGKAQVVALCDALENAVGAEGEGSAKGPASRDAAPAAGLRAPREGGAAAKGAGAPEHAVRYGGGFRTRAGIKVQDGCDNACTYCIVHVARGRARSVDAACVLRQARDLARAGAHEIVLSGINLATYNYEGLNLAGLVAKLIRACPGVRFRISSVEPRDVDESLIRLLAESDGWACRHLHLPLQSGSTKVLREMARPYTAEEFLELVGRIREAVPGISLSTDIIAGFPGETEDDFNQTLQVARACGFSKIHAFRYSRREGTPAAARPDQVPGEVAASRAKRLAALGRELRLSDAAARVGTVERVLVEAEGRGMTESYFPVKAGTAARRGNLVRCTLARIDEDGAFSL